MNISDWIPAEALVPDSAARWRAPIQESFQFLFTRLSQPRLAAKIAEQMMLPPNTPPERRLVQLIAKMPGLQKIGQVVARNRRVPEALRLALVDLENGMSDVTASEIRAIIRDRLGPRLKEFDVELDSRILSEASVSAVIRFTWRNPNRERGRGVFKVLKPHVPGCFAEDMRLLQKLGEYLTSREKKYGFAVREVDETLTEVRLLLTHELEFTREQATLAEAEEIYHGTLGIRVPRVITPLCTSDITAMSEETGVKVTDAVRRSTIRRRRIANQLLEALIAVPLFSNRAASVFHADPHAGNLLYDEPNRELVILDWALAERLPLAARRQVILLAIMMTLQNREAVIQSITALRRPGPPRGADRIIACEVGDFFERLPDGHTPGVLDAMRLLDEIALQGVRFEPTLFLFRKSLFTLDGVLEDVAGSEVRMDEVMTRHFLTRWASSFGLFYSPLAFRDVVSLEWNAMLYPARWIGQKLLRIGKK